MSEGDTDLSADGSTRPSPACQVVHSERHPKVPVVPIVGNGHTHQLRETKKGKRS